MILSLSFRFELSHFVDLSNLSISGNKFRGCSTITSQHSVLNISNSIFVGIRGVISVALMKLRSMVTLKGTNIFIGNTAASGGSIYLFHSRLSLKGSNIFLNNTSRRKVC